MDTNQNKLAHLILIFKQILKDKDSLIESITPIQSGYTNHTYCVKTKYNQFQFRIASNNNIVNRDNEYNVLVNTDLIKTDYIYYDTKTGDSIKKWIDGENLLIVPLNSYNDNQIKQIIININNKIIKLHQFKTNNIIKHNNFVFIDYLSAETKQSLKTYLDMYNELIEQYYNYEDQNDINDQFVLSHNDLSLSNVIIDIDLNINFIDFEWTRVNRGYWDYANFIREADLSIELVKYWCSINQTLIFNKLIVYIYLTTCFAIQWSYTTTQNTSVLEYRKKTMIKLNKYYQWIKEIIYG